MHTPAFTAVSSPVPFSGCPKLGSVLQRWAAFTGSKWVVSTGKRRPNCMPVFQAHVTKGSIKMGVEPISYSDSEDDVTSLPDAYLSDTVPDTDLVERQRRESILSDTPTDIPIPPKPTVVEVEFTPGRTLRLETGRLARQAAGAVTARLGDTIVFCTACAENSASPSVDFVPLRVDYSEKFSATGKTSGSYVKREGRPSEREVLVSRLIDRPLRPMFADGYFNEIQVLANVFSYDEQFPADALAICGSSAALHISQIPLVEPVAGVRIAYIDDRFVVEPSRDDAKRATAELVVAGTRHGLLMIEGYCEFLTEDVILHGIRTAHTSIIRICDGIDQLRKQMGERSKDTDVLRTVSSALRIQISQLAIGLDDALTVVSKKARDQYVQRVRDRVFKVLGPTRQEELDAPDHTAERWTILRLAWKEHVAERMRRRILDTGIRPDGRDVFTVRPITIDVAPLPRAHGSAVFTRGETQTLAVATLGGDEMAQRYETLEGEDAARFYLQYSFPPFSVGEVGRMGPPGRREIGHGKLAERALMAAIPDEKEFPYVLRVESNILESNGSSSMASVCGGCLALLDAGVPLKCSVAGVAMGLVVDKTGAVDENGELPTVVLTDILGLEDALGSCDAKFAGNRQGWSALQLDVKLRGISIDLFARILQQAAKGRDHILDCMDQIMPTHRSRLPSSLPKVEVMTIPSKRIGDVIGQGGKTIRSIIDKCGGDDAVRISIDNDGRVSISSANEAIIQKAKAMVSSHSVNIEVGKIYNATVSKIIPFGAYVELTEGKEGWLHISELEHKRTVTMEDVISTGDKLEVKVTEVGRNGQIRVSRKALLPKEQSDMDGKHREETPSSRDANGEGKRGVGRSSSDSKLLEKLEPLDLDSDSP